MQCLDDPEEIFEATTWFEDLSDENRRFVQRIQKWLDISERLPSVDANDSASQYGSSSVFRKLPSSVSKAISRLTVKVKEAKVEEALSELKLQRLKKKFDLQQRRVVVQREEELLEVENKIEQARLRVQILEEGEGYKDHFAYSFDPPPTSVFHEPRVTTRELLLSRTPVLRRSLHLHTRLCHRETRRTRYTRVPI